MGSASKFLSLPLWGGVSAVVAVVALSISLLPNEDNQHKDVVYNQTTQTGENNVLVQGGDNSFNFSSNTPTDKLEKELWSKNWGILKKERLERRSRDCDGMSSKYDVYDRESILKSLQMLDLNATPKLSTLRGELALAIKSAPKTTVRECPTLGDFPGIDLHMIDHLDVMWGTIKIGVKSKAESVGVDVAFKWDI